MKTNYSKMTDDELNRIVAEIERLTLVNPRFPHSQMCKDLKVDIALRKSLDKLKEVTA